MTDWDDDLDSLAAFPSEQDLPIHDEARTALPDVQASPAPKRAWRPFAVGVLAATLSLTAVQLGAARWNSEPETGGVKVETTPAGADVIIDGKRHGVTPLTLSLAPGSHSITVRLGGKERSVPVAVTAGGVISQYFELIPAVPQTLAVDNRRAAVESVGDRGTADEGRADERTAGRKPAAEKRADKAHADNGGQRPSVEPSQPRATTGISASAAREPASTTGWLTIVAPFAIQVIENGVTLGVSTAPRIILAPGQHDLVLVNRALDYSEARSIRIAAGGGTMIRVDPPPVVPNQ
jgi:hypothetical protein